MLYRRSTVEKRWFWRWTVMVFSRTPLQPVKRWEALWILLNRRSLSFALSRAELGLHLTCLRGISDGISSNLLESIASLLSFVDINLFLKPLNVWSVVCFNISCSPQAEGSDTKAGAELLEIMFKKVSHDFMTNFSSVYLSLGSYMSIRIVLAPW